MNIINIKFTSTMILLTILATLFFPGVGFASKVSDGSSIAGISLEDVTIEEAEQELQLYISEWQDEAPLEAKNDFESLEIPREIFQFDLATSIEQLEDKMKRHWSNFFMKQENVHQELFVSLIPEPEEMLNWPAHIDVEKTLDHALLQASNLSNNPVSLVYIEGSNMEQEEVAAVSLKIPDISESTVDYLIENLNEQIIEPNRIYSFLEENTLPNGTTNSEEEMSLLGSALYELVLQTNIEIIERHSQKEIPSYSEAGLEAKVNREKELDLRLYHTNNFAFTVRAAINEETIELSLEAAANEINYSFSKENEVEIEPRKIYRYNKNLVPGTEDVIQEGEPGLQVEIYRSSSKVDGSEAEKELIARDFYSPVPEIIERSVADETESNEEQLAAQTPSNEGMQIVTPEMDSMVDRWMPQIDERQAICEEDPSNPDCQQTDVSLLPLLLSCLTDGSPSLHTGEEVESEESAEASSSSFCDLFMYFLLLAMVDNDLLDEETDQIDNDFLNEEDGDVETDTDINEEEAGEEVRY